MDADDLVQHPVSKVQAPVHRVVVEAGGVVDVVDGDGDVAHGQQVHADEDPAQPRVQQVDDVVLDTHWWRGREGRGGGG